MFYRFNRSRLSLREYLFEGNWFSKPFVFLIGVVVKLFRIRLPGSTDVPAVPSLHPFLVAGDALPSDLAELLEPTVEDLRRCGFCGVGTLHINDIERNTRYGGRVMLSLQGDAVAWVRNRRWPQLPRRSRFTRVALFSLFRNGNVFLTTTADRDLLDPPHWSVQYCTGAPVERLLEVHQQHVGEQPGAGFCRKIAVSNAIDCLEYVQEDFVSFQLDRGVFEPVISSGDPAARVLLEAESLAELSVPSYRLDSLSPNNNFSRRSE